MKVIGFTFIRNAIRYDYPIEAAIRSILPLCEEVVVAVGESEDDTLALVQSIDPRKVRILRTVWNDELREGGRVLAEETNKALAAVAEEADWAIYIQGDEVLHEQYLPAVRRSLERYRSDERVDGLLFDYRHFYGSYDYVGATSRWYRHEVRVVRPGRGIYSYRDAQGFRKGDDQKLRVRPAGAEMYHYGWVKPPDAMQRKRANLDSLWHSDDWVERHVPADADFDYRGIIDALEPFEGTHPKVLQARIERRNWTFDYDISFNQYGWKERIRQWIERHTGWRPGEYRNYRLLR